MNNPTDFLTDADLALNSLGGQNLSGSGFESESPEPEFGLDNDEPEGTGR